MKEEYQELKEDVLDEQEAIDETIKRLLEAKEKIDPQKQDNLTEPAMGTYLMNFYNGIHGCPNVFELIFVTI